MSPWEFGFLDHMEPVYRGFPLLGEILQGLLWILFDHVQAANLLSLGSLVLYCYAVRVFLQIPWYATFVALVAVPLVQIHATGSLVDLPANLATAVLLLLVFRLCAGSEMPSWKQLLVLALAAGVSVNVKFLHSGVVLLALGAMVGRLAYLYRIRQAARRRIAQMLLFLVAAMPLIFVTAIKNTILYKNPFYPIAVRFVGVTAVASPVQTEKGVSLDGELHAM